VGQAKSVETAKRRLPSIVERIHEYSEGLEHDTNVYRGFQSEYKKFVYDSDSINKKYPTDITPTVKPEEKEDWEKAWDNVPDEIKTQIFKNVKGANELFHKRKRCLISTRGISTRVKYIIKAKRLWQQTHYKTWA
jgi:hypothetical protein